MNKILFFIALLAMPNLSAQEFKLTTDFNNYRAADKLVKQQVEFKDPGSKGRDLLWDFSFVQAKNEGYTLDYFIPDSTDMTRLCGMEHNTRYYYGQKTDTLLTLGYENSTTYMEYVQPELRMRFPFQYGDTLFSTFEGVGEYCHQLALAVKGSTRVEADAEGELLLPQSEVVKKALRVHTQRHYTQTGKDSLEMTHDTYSWYAAGIRYPVFESIKTTLLKTGNTADTTVFTTSFYYPPEKQTQQIATDPLPTELQEPPLQGIAAVFTEAKLMPNPVVDNLNIDFKLTRPARVWFTVHNNAGIPLCQTAPQQLTDGYHTTSVNMSQLVTSTYALYVHVDNMVMRMSVVKK